MGYIQIHFDGDITTNHQISMRTLSKSLGHLQNSIDRAFLEYHYGKLWKYAKMQHQWYPEVELLVQSPREGGYFLDFLTENPVTKSIIDRVSGAVKEAVESSQQEGLANTTSIEKSFHDRITQIENSLVVPKEFKEIIDNPDDAIVRKYGDRAIVREIDQILSIIRAEYAGESTFEMVLQGDTSLTFDFNKENAKQFHTVVVRKELGSPLLYKSSISSLDRHNLNGKIVNKETEKVANIHFVNEESLQLAIPFFDKKEIMPFIGSPMIEYGAFDPMAGDIYFLGLA